MTPRKLLRRLATSQTNVRFSDLVRLAVALGFVLDRTSGSHHIYIHKVYTDAQLNLQPAKSQAKPYQIRQLLRLVEEYNLQIEDHE
jgi:predicted RNA binding protein YcfA (HicA-like mRNA interferase family)